jgi:hypothetical protein
MGEGISCLSDVGLATTQIYSCMGIAFVNRATRRGGLYHYPAGTLGEGALNANVQNTIRQMFNDINPDEVCVTPAGDQGITGNGSSQNDIADVLNYLRSINRGVRITPGTRGAFATLTWNDDGPVYNAKPPAGMQANSVPTTYRQTMSSGQREVEGNIWYYGGDGETEGVLSQGLKTTKQSAASCCTIL